MANRSSGAEEITTFVNPRSVNIQNVQVTQSRILPPYGITVTAEVASLTLEISTSKEDTAGRLEDIQQALAHISTLASESDDVDLGDISVNQVGGSAERISSAPYVTNLDASSVTLKLTTALAKHNYNLIESLVVFNNFLKAIELPETITVQALSIEKEISNPEQYREQLIAKVYQELNVIQEEYGESVKFGITGLHSSLQVIKLTDTEYYLYIEPEIVVNEF
jgi:hypothetical protein